MSAITLMRPRPLAGPLPARTPDGSYPYRSHRTCAEWMPVCPNQATQS